MDNQELRFRQILIVPTRSGCYYLGVSVLLLLVAYNYKNSLIYFLSFLMVSLFLVSILYCYKNLVGLRISGASVHSAFVGEPAVFPIRLEGIKRDYYCICVDNQNSSVDVAKSDESVVNLIRPATRRGRLPLGAFRVTSHYPLGLLCGSAWVNISQEMLVYPRPVDPVFSPPNSIVSGGKGEERIADTGDFYGLRDYHPGDRLNHIAWKMVSKEQGMFCKQFSEPVSTSQLFSLNALEQYPLETALSYLCHWVLAAHRNGESYGLDLGAHGQPLGTGDVHLHACLTLLARV